MPVRDVKEKSGDEGRKKEKSKAHAPSHTKIRSIGMLDFSNNDPVGYTAYTVYLCMCNTCMSVLHRSGDGGF